MTTRQTILYHLDLRVLTHGSQAIERLNLERLFLHLKYVEVQLCAACTSTSVTIREMPMPDAIGSLQGGAGAQIESGGACAI